MFSAKKNQGKKRREKVWKKKKKLAVELVHLVSCRDFFFAGDYTDFYESLFMQYECIYLDIFFTLAKRGLGSERQMT